MSSESEEKGTRIQKRQGQKQLFCPSTQTSDRPDYFCFHPISMQEKFRPDASKAAKERTKVWHLPEKVFDICSDFPELLVQKRQRSWTNKGRKKRLKEKGRK
jgi:hypothetical protein